MPYEMLGPNPLKFMTDICDYIGIEPEIYKGYIFNKINVSMSAKNQLLHNLALFINAKLEPLLRKNPLVKDFFKEYYLRLNADIIGYKQISYADSVRLGNYYYSSIQDLIKTS